MQVVPIEGARASRDHKRLRELQAEFGRRGCALDPLTEGTWYFQDGRGSHQVLRSLDAAQRLLDQIKSVAS